MPRYTTTITDLAPMVTMTIEVEADNPSDANTKLLDCFETLTDGDLLFPVIEWEVSTWNE